ncbi:Gfo/Idh/MocA family protein [Sphingomonas nostoxanthinifaciens]|uniref:Gfo/Idh/MocA family protein n=1 Tax=Sphingomonas nostoxanthinifaciens TaxID=2872652 RepID=UPI001CC203B1|nr:Gfo/Idh/MocA family oxidoreductase [Sphingomonas nostoxanthinifaciens]UAK23482.1 Gfo/Idh/MocA family oxidoreductase [Sphingomonas nostoxanthinifaciens]
MSDTAAAPLRLGILSTANIARHFAAGVAGSDKVSLVAVASRDRDRAGQFAEANGIVRVVDSYDALLADPEIEAIYNPLPNSLHAEWSIRALEAGKHVLCEKPIALDADEARTMYDAARRAGRHLVEAFPYRAQPLTHALAGIVGSGEIGRPRTIHAAFGFPVANAANIRLDPALGGGAMLDAGTYAVSLVRMLAGAMPVRVTASAVLSERGVDLTTTASLDFADGLLAQISCAFGTGLHRRAIVACEGGVVTTDFPNHLTAEKPGLLQVSRGGWEPKDERIDFAPLNGFRAEADSFADLVRTGTEAWNGIGEAESIEVMRILDAITLSAREGRPVTP